MPNDDDDIDPIPYLGPDDGVTARIVDQLNARINREGFTEDVIRGALISLFGMVGQLEHYVMELERNARGESILQGSSEQHVERPFKQLMKDLNLDD